eukprot:CAMPEP_0181339328 /NCGR_PEP_ID=MMETSP1101-20121128/29189_1 /TAXON_ID=46948 /ORGANISM="Rhodomonas abbreviata, Strain Caron Lab Isolate" /LENGTH=47 /DNA_ID= /DNA_START= /DNA_END= /DNA_ORIENTATION=
MRMGSPSTSLAREHTWAPRRRASPAAAPRRPGPECTAPQSGPSGGGP